MPSPWHPSSPCDRQPLFLQTVWSSISCPAEAAEARKARARERIFEDYWRPIFLLICARGHTPEEARDLSQGFWLHFFESNASSRADPAKGRFRDFLSAALNHYLSDVRDHHRTQRRGGGAVHVSVDGPEALQVASPDSRQGEQRGGCASDLVWAKAVLARALVLLETKYQRPGRREIFLALQPGLLGEEGAPGYAQLAEELGRPEETLRSEAMRLRRLLSDMVAQALTEQVGPERLSEEWQILHAILRQR